MKGMCRSNANQIERKTNHCKGTSSSVITTVRSSIYSCHSSRGVASVAVDDGNLSCYSQCQHRPQTDVLLPEYTLEVAQDNRDFSIHYHINFTSGLSPKSARKKTKILDWVEEEKEASPLTTRSLVPHCEECDFWKFKIENVIDRDAMMSPCDPVPVIVSKGVTIKHKGYEYGYGCIIFAVSNSSLWECGQCSTSLLLWTRTQEVRQKSEHRECKIGNRFNGKQMCEPIFFNI